MEAERDRESEELNQLKEELNHVESQLESQLDRLTSSDEKKRGANDVQLRSLTGKLLEKDNRITALTERLSEAELCIQDLKGQANLRAAQAAELEEMLGSQQA